MSTLHSRAFYRDPRATAGCALSPQLHGTMPRLIRPAEQQSLLTSEQLGFWSFPAPLLLVPIPTWKLHLSSFCPIHSAAYRITPWYVSPEMAQVRQNHLVKPIKLTWSISIDYKKKERLYGRWSMGRCKWCGAAGSVMTNGCVRTSASQLPPRSLPCSVI